MPATSFYAAAAYPGTPSVPSAVGQTAIVGQAVRSGYTLIGNIVEVSGPTVPTTGQIWPRGNR
jgi:hypothetical protein